MISRDDELWLLTPIHFDARLIDRATPVTGPYTVGRFTFRQRCGGCGGYFGSSAAARVWCVYINSKRSKKTAPAAPALAGRQTPPNPRRKPADPEPFTLNRETGAKGEVSKNQGTGYGVRCLPLITDSPLPFPDSGMLLRGIRIDRFKVKLLPIQASGIRMRGSVMR